MGEDGGIDFEKLDKRKSEHDCRVNASWAKEGKSGDKTIHIADHLRKLVSDNGYACAEYDQLYSSLCGEGRHPGGLSAVVKKNFHLVPVLAECLDATAVALRRGGMQDKVNSQRSDAGPFSDVIGPMRSMVACGHRNMNNYKCYDPSGMANSAINSSSTCDPQTTPDLSHVLFQSSQLIHNLPMETSKKTFEIALKEKEEGGRHSQEYCSNMFLVKEILKEVFNEYEHSVGRMMSFDVCVKRVFNCWFLKSQEHTEANLTSWRDSPKQLKEAAFESLCRTLWELKPGGSLDAMHTWIDENLSILMTETLITTSGKKLDVPWRPKRVVGGAGEAGNEAVDDADCEIIESNSQSESRTGVGGGGGGGLTQLGNYVFTTAPP